MPITSKAAVEAEYATRRDSILAYPAGSLDDDVAKLEVLATAVAECLAVLRGREALNSRPTSTPAIERIASATGQLGAIPALVRGYAAEIKAALAEVDAPVAP